MNINLRQECGNMMYGKSTHDKHIERLLRDVRNGVTGFHHKMFCFLQDKKILDPFITQLNFLQIHLAHAYIARP